MMKRRALLIFSGGQDSATCLAWALERFDEVMTLGFAYGQRHEVEMSCREGLRESISSLQVLWRQRLGGDVVLNTDFFQHISQTSLTADVPILGSNTFVPGRNLIFLSMAAAWAYGQGVRHIVMGVCETDYSGYADCRDDSIKAMQVALNRGMDTDYVIHTPLMWRTKAQTWALARALGGTALVEIIREQTHTCYSGDRSHLHYWGYGCAQCPACVLRARGYDEYMQEEHLR